MDERTPAERYVELKREAFVAQEEAQRMASASSQAETAWSSQRRRFGDAVDKYAEAPHSSELSQKQIADIGIRCARLENAFRAAAERTELAKAAVDAKNKEVEQAWADLLKATPA